MKTLHRVLMSLSLLLLLTSSTFYGIQAQGFPPLPHAFYGRVYINGEEAPIGTRVEGRGENVVTGIQGNPIETVAKGFYGSTDSSVINLVIQGWVTDGTPIEFYVNGQKAFCSDGGDWEESYPFQAGGITALDLWVGTFETPEPLPTFTPTPTFAPTVPKTPTSTQSAIRTATLAPTLPKTPTSTQSANLTATLTPTLTPSRTVMNTEPELSQTAQAISLSETEGGSGSGTIDSTQNEIIKEQENVVPGNAVILEKEAGGINPLLIIASVVILAAIGYTIWRVLRNRKTESKSDDLL